MDVSIQSQIKSPLCRALQSIPTNSNNFLPGIPDNTPPFSKTSITIHPSVDTSANLKGVQVFKLPQNGRLSNVYLKYRMIGHKNDEDFTLLHDADNVFSFGHGIESIQLRTHNNVIQSIPAAAIPFENASVCRSEQELKHTLQGLAGYEGNDLSLIYDPPRLNVPAFNPSTAVTSSSITSRQGELVVWDFLIRVPLSSTFYLKDNLQTRMMEDLELVVKTKMSVTQYAGTVFADTTPLAKVDRHELTAVAEYINFHENVEEVIRNEMFKPDVPATMLQSDYDTFTAKFVRAESTGTVAKHLYYEVNLTSDALATDIFVVPKVHPVNFGYEAFHSVRNAGVTYKLIASGETILEGNRFEIEGVEAKHYSTVSRQYQNPGVLPIRWAENGSRIRLGLNNTDEYFDGGISLQSLIEPKLEIRVTSNNEFSVAADVGGGESFIIDEAEAGLLEFDVVVKRKVLLRIDGNTGKISKSLES